MLDSDINTFSKVIFILFCEESVYLSSVRSDRIPLFTVSVNKIVCGVAVWSAEIDDLDPLPIFAIGVDGARSNKVVLRCSIICCDDVADEA